MFRNKKSAVFAKMNWPPRLIRRPTRRGGRKIPPFVDGSIRREPDFQCELPSITSLCRGRNFARHLGVGDVVCYITNKRKFKRTDNPERRLTAIVRVQLVLPSHEAAAQWYERRDLPIPNNCMVDRNPAMPLDHSHGINEGRKHYSGDRLWRRWDLGYKFRAEDSPEFVVCEPPLFLDLTWGAPLVSDNGLIAVFGEIPGLLNPKKRQLSEFYALTSHLGIPVRPSAR
jgi:hypothetical protein